MRGAWGGGLEDCQFVEVMRNWLVWSGWVESNGGQRGWRGGRAVWVISAAGRTGQDAQVQAGR